MTEIEIINRKYTTFVDSFVHSDSIKVIEQAHFRPINQNFVVKLFSKSWHKLSDYMQIKSDTSKKTANLIELVAITVPLNLGG